jgi:hypothetical protein
MGTQTMLHHREGEVEQGRRLKQSAAAGLESAHARGYDTHGV